MKIKKFIAIATAAAFALTGTSYAETGENLATEGSDVTEVVEDISLTGDRIEADEESYYTGDLTVNFSLYDESGISNVAIKVNGETIAERDYDSEECIETEDGEVMNADSTVETEGEAAEASTSEPLTTVSDSLVITADQIKEIKDAKAEEPAEPQEPDAAEPEEPAESDQNEAADQEAVETPEAEAAGTEAVETPESEVADPEAAETPEVEAADSEAAETPEAEATEPEQTETPAEEDAAATDTIKAQMVITDVSGQITTKEFEFNAAPAETAAEEQEAVDELKAKGLNDVQVIDATTYRVEVNITCQAATVFKKQPNGTYKAIRVSVCSTGLNGKTPTGTFTIGPYKKKCARSRWAVMSSGKAFAQYLVRIKHGICFHSVIYKTRGDNSKMYSKEYNKLGRTASAGCVRLRALDAKWIYDHCPNGTKVKIYKSSTASPLGVPTYKKLTTSNKFSWDPTDPDTGNPFRGGNGTPTGIFVAYNDGEPYLTMDPDISKHYITLSSKTLAYNGKSRKPSVTIYGLTKGTNFSVTYPSVCTKVGTYPITIKGIGSFTGTAKVYYSIVPKSTKITSLKRSGSKKFKVKYKKVTKQISGYEIMYSPKSDFSKNCKTKKVSSYKTTSKKIKVSSKGKYYVKVRVYKKVDGKTYYGSWSKSKKIKVK